nr:GAF domain-containing protein [Propionibacteriales bacterium]
MVVGDLSDNRPRALDLPAMLDVLAQTIVNALGFEVAVVNIVESARRVVAVSVAGPAEVRHHILGSSGTLSNWRRLLDSGQGWGRLVFIDHAVVDYDDVCDLTSWVPDVDASDDPGVWHPDDVLLAPLWSSDGSLLGVLSVDLPRGGRRPDDDTRTSLEAFAVSAALAVEHATLRA